MDAVERLVGSGEPRAHASIVKPAEPLEGEPEPVIETRTQTNDKQTAPVEQPVRARLGYDPFESEIFVEILNPRTGDVLRRFPAERAAEEAGELRDGGTILNRFA